MRESSCKIVVAAMAIGVGLSTTNAQSANPACQRLEAQLATLNQGNADPARADQIGARKTWSIASNLRWTGW